MFGGRRRSLKACVLAIRFTCLPTSGRVKAKDADEQLRVPHGATPTVPTSAHQHGRDRPVRQEAGEFPMLKMLAKLLGILILIRFVPMRNRSTVVCHPYVGCLGGLTRCTHFVGSFMQAATRHSVFACFFCRLQLFLVDCVLGCSGKRMSCSLAATHGYHPIHYARDSMYLTLWTLRVSPVYVHRHFTVCLSPALDSMYFIIYYHLCPSVDGFRQTYRVARER